MRALLLLLALAACADIPELGPDGTAAARAAPWPQLRPIDEVLAPAAALGRAPAPQAGLDARAAALRARAAALRQPVVSEDEEARLRAMQARH